MAKDKIKIRLEDEALAPSAPTAELYKLEGDAKLPNVHERARAERLLIRKLDSRLLPMVILIYLMNNVDRAAITSARLKGLEQDLQLTDLQYQTVIAIIYVGVCSIAVPSNMLMNKVTRPSLYIGGCVIVWGVISALTGITHSYSGILVCRLLLGIPEAAFYPGAVYLLSRWYTHQEIALRAPLLYVGFIISNGFGSLMAAGILSNMEGKRGIRAWRWLFFIFGAITVAIGVSTLFILPDYPHNTRSLSAAERRLAQARLAEDVGEADRDEAEDSAWSGLKLAIMDPKVALFSLATFSILLASSFVNFFPTLTATLGFNLTDTLLLGAPPWIWAAVVAILVARHADRSGGRFFHMTVPWCITMLGYIIAVSTTSIAGRYFAMFLMTTLYAGSGLISVWVVNVHPRPPAKRAAAVGTVTSIGNLGLLAGSFVWKAKWGPQYHQSMIIGIVAVACACLSAFGVRCIIVAKNKQLNSDELGALKDASQGRVKEAARLEGITLQEAEDNKRRYRYLY